MLNSTRVAIPGGYKKHLGGMKMKQYPGEISQLASFLYGIKNEIKKYVEIGVERGGTFFFIDSYLRRINPDFNESLGIDSSGKIEESIKRYQKKFPSCHFLLSRSADVEFPDDIDFCFIDGNHSYEGVKRDFEAVKNKAKYIGFHDIHFIDNKVGVPRFWKEIKEDYTHVEFAASKDIFPVALGIGVLKIH